MVWRFKLPPNLIHNRPLKMSDEGLYKNVTPQTTERNCSSAAVAGRSTAHHLLANTPLENVSFAFITVKLCISSKKLP